MNKEAIDGFKKLFFEYPDNTKLKTYAIADSVREPKLKEKLLHSGLDNRELWHDEIVEDTFEIPLYLIKLEKDNELTDWLINHHEKNIVTYFQSPYSIDELHDYYSPLTLPKIGVNDGSYERAIFGFFDPLVLSDYIDTLYTPEKRDEFFAASAIWFSPIAEKENKCYYAYIKEDSAKLEKNILDLSSDKEKINYETIKIPDDLLSNDNIAVIDHEQVELFKQAGKKRFCIKVLGLLDEKETDNNLSTAVEAFDYSRKLGIDSEANELRVIQIALNLPSTITKGYDEHFKLVKQADTEFEKAERLDVILVTMQLEEKTKNET